MTVHEKKQQVKLMRTEVDRLKRERDLERMPVSEAMKDLCRFIGENERTDRLLNNLPADNPYVASQAPRFGCIGFCSS